MVTSSPTPPPSHFSLEVFPPKTEKGLNKLYESLTQWQGLTPDFISVTCPNPPQQLAKRTIELADYIQSTLDILTVVHLPAMYLNEKDVHSILQVLRQRGINKLLALRGDPLTQCSPAASFAHATDLVEFIRESAPDFELSGAGYPEGHPESSSRLQDIHSLKRKVEAGCQQVISQFFLDNTLFYRFQEDCRLAQIEVPIIAGIMPIVKRDQALRLLATSQCFLPTKFRAQLERYQHNPIALRDAGIAYAVDQIADLLTQGVEGIHLYTMNDADMPCQIYRSIRSLLPFASFTIN